ncbi:MAG: hypothetical protein WBF53_11970 [Litorimonas sp.]
MLTDLLKGPRDESPDFKAGRVVGMIEMAAIDSGLTDPTIREIIEIAAREVRRR